MKKNRWSMGALVAAGMSVAGAGPAVAQSCADLVERFAATQSLTVSPPPVAPPTAQGTLPPGTADSTRVDGGGTGTVTSEELAQSGGVITPPAVGDTVVIEPPRSGSSGMPTAPPISPDAGPTTDAPTGGAMGQAAQTAQLEALVTGARQAAKSGDEARCMEILSQARRLSQTAPGESGGGG